MQLYLLFQQWEQLLPAPCLQQLCLERQQQRHQQLRGQQYQQQEAQCQLCRSQVDKTVGSRSTAVHAMLQSVTWSIRMPRGSVVEHGLKAWVLCCALQSPT
jgi:hypothetical protein